jgi:hypothetical protein
MHVARTSNSQPEFFPECPSLFLSKSSVREGEQCLIEFGQKSLPGRKWPREPSFTLRSRITLKVNVFNQKNVRPDEAAAMDRFIHLVDVLPASLSASQLSTGALRVVQYQIEPNSRS